MENKQQKGQQMRFNKEELAIIKGLFNDNEEALKLMRKVFLPELDPKAPLGQMIDIYRTIQTEGKMMQDVVVAIESRNFVIAHVDMQLQQLQILAGMEDETPKQRTEREAKNSTK